MYTLIGSVKTRAIRVAWLLEEMGIEFEHMHSSPRAEPVITHYRAGKVPVLLDGETALTDSVAIMTYLSDKHDQFTKPAGTTERAIQDGHTHFLNEEFDSILWIASKHKFILPEENRVPAIIDALAWEFETSLKRLEERLGDGPYLMGETLTVPDMLAAHCHRWSVNIGFPQPSAHVAAYLTGLRDRPAFKRAAALAAA